MVHSGSCQPASRFVSSSALTHDTDASEILIVGTGETVLPVPSRVRSRIHSLGIQLDVQNTVSDWN